jgi:hypothetical protein
MGQSLYLRMLARTFCIGDCTTYSSLAFQKKKYITRPLQLTTRTGLRAILHNVAGALGWGGMKLPSHFWETEKNTFKNAKTYWGKGGQLFADFHFSRCVLEPNPTPARRRIYDCMQPVYIPVLEPGQCSQYTDKTTV